MTKKNRSKFSVKKINKVINNKGFVIIKNIFSKKYCENLKKEIFLLKNDLKNNPYFKDEGSSKGQFILRDLVLRNPNIFLRVVSNKFLVTVIESIFRDKFILDNIMASDSLNVKEKFSRKVHIDSQLPMRGVELATDVIVMICLDPFKKNNGATKLWPKSHLSGIRIHHSPNKLKNKHNNYKYLEAPQGSVAFILGQTWHQVGKNDSNETRMSIFLHYKRWWMKPSTDFTKCGKKIFNMLNNKQKELFGFNCISPSFNFKNKTKEIYTLRDINKVSKNYFRSLQH
jgi:hypothetical protein